MMLATHVDPRGMIRVFEKFEEQHNKSESTKKDSVKGGEAPPKWTKYLSTHPESNNRVEVLKKLSEHSVQKPRPLLPDFDWKTMYRETKESDFIF